MPYPFPREYRNMREDWPSVKPCKVESQLHLLGSKYSPLQRFNISRNSSHDCWHDNFSTKYISN